MKKNFVLGFIIGCLVASWAWSIHAKAVENANIYNELPGNTTWKIKMNPNSGFKLINSKGEVKSYGGSTNDWNIDLETGKCYYDR